MVQLYNINKNKSIKEQLEEVQELIIENKKLQNELPQHKKGLQISLKTLQKVEQEMFNALSAEECSNFSEVYEFHIKGDKINNHSISFNILGDFLIKTQELVDIFSEDPLSIHGSPNYNSENKLNFVACSEGSFKILLTTSQKVLISEGAETPVISAFNKLNHLIRKGDDVESLGKLVPKIGEKQFYTYKSFLQFLTEKKISFELTKKTKTSNLKISELNHSQSKNIFNSLSSIKEEKEEIILLTGQLKAIDLISNKIRIVYEDNKKISINYNKMNINEEELINKLNKLVEVKIKKINSKKEIWEKNKFKYELYELD